MLILLFRTFTSLRGPSRPSIFPSSTFRPTLLSNDPAGTVGAIDLLPNISSHPALATTQIRCAPRNTYNPSHFVRKRRHGFLSRLKTRTGRMTLARRRAKGRRFLSHWGVWGLGFLWRGGFGERVYALAFERKLLEVGWEMYESQWVRECRPAGFVWIWKATAYDMRIHNLPAKISWDRSKASSLLLITLLHLPSLLYRSNGYTGKSLEMEFRFIYQISTT